MRIWLNLAYLACYKISLKNSNCNIFGHHIFYYTFFDKKCRRRQPMHFSRSTAACTFHHAHRKYIKKKLRHITWHFICNGYHCLFICPQDDSDEEEDEPLAFHEMGLDDRILKSIAKLGWSVPTLIQVTITYY